MTINFNGFSSLDSNYIDRVPNEFFDIIVKEENASVIKVVGMIFRYTNGYKKKLFTIKFLQKITNLSNRAVIDALERAISKKYILKIKYIPNKGNILKIRYKHDISGYIPSGYVYIIKSNKYHKIGSTINIQRRLGEIQNSNASKVYYIFNKQISNYIKIEKKIHKLYKHKRIYGEWFNLNSVDIKNIKELIIKEVKI